MNPHVSSGLEAVILRALEKDRNLRYQSAADMRAELQRLKRDSDSDRHVAAKSSTPANSVQTPEAPPSPSGTVAPPKTRRLLLAGAAVVLIGVLIAGGLYFRSHRNKVICQPIDHNMKTNVRMQWITATRAYAIQYL